MRYPVIILILIGWSCGQSSSSSNKSLERKVIEYVQLMCDCPNEYGQTLSSLLEDDYKKFTHLSKSEYLQEQYKEFDLEKDDYWLFKEYAKNEKEDRMIKACKSKKSKLGIELSLNELNEIELYELIKKFFQPDIQEELGFSRFCLERFILQGFSLKEIEEKLQTK